MKTRPKRRHDVCLFVSLSAEVPAAGSNSLMSVLAEKAIVKKEELWDVVGTDKWSINNSLDEKYKPRPAHVIVRDACSRVGQELPYCVFRSNCEHFTNELRYGKAESRQVDSYSFFSKSLKASGSVTFDPKGHNSLRF